MLFWEHWVSGEVEASILALLTGRSALFSQGFLRQIAGRMSRTGLKLLIGAGALAYIHR